MTEIIRPPSTEPVLVSTATGRGGLIAPGDAPLATVLVVVMRHLRLLILVPFVMAVLTVAWIMFTREFWAQSKLAPHRGDMTSGLMGLAASVGVSVPTSRPNESLEFYVDLLKSRELLDSAVLTKYRFAVGPGERDTLSGTLIELYEIDLPSPTAQLRRARGRLTRAVQATPRRPSGTLTLRTTAPYPRLAEQVNRRLLELVNQFNTHRRMSQGGAERRFLEARLGEARADLEQARDAQRRFLEKNRVWQGDPRLTVEMQGLEDQIAARAAVIQGLNDSYERARLDEVQNTPLVTVVEAPENSGRREGGLTMSALAALVIGSILALALALLIEYAARERALHPEAYDAVRRLWQSRPFGRRFQPRGQ